MEERTFENFLKLKQPLWEKNSIKMLFDFLEKSLEKSKEDFQDSRDFELLILEIQQAYRTFYRNIENIRLIVNTRVKGNNSSNFGGLECAEFMNSIRNACEKYLNKTDKENQLIRQLREKAKTDEKIAREIEYKNKENYVNFSKDNTLEMLQIAGYDV